MKKPLTFVGGFFVYKGREREFTPTEQGGKAATTAAEVNTLDFYKLSGRKRKKSESPPRHMKKPLANVRGFFVFSYI